MYNGKRIGVVIPAYNEEGLVGEVIDTLPPIVDRAYVIDDCSVDGTWSEIQQHAERRENERSDGGRVVEEHTTVTPIRHDTNHGVGRSIKTGYERALEDDIDVVAVMDGDGQMNPDDLPRILQPIVEEKSDYAKGDRLSFRRNYGLMSSWRLLGNCLLTLLTRAASGYWEMRDSQNGYTAISAETLESIPYEDLYDEYGFLNNILTVLHIHGMTIADVQHEAVYDEEQSHISYRSFIPKVSKLLLQNFARRLKREYIDGGVHPAVLGYSLGIAGLVAEFLVTIYRSFRSVEGDRSGSRFSPLLLTGAVSTLLGLSWDSREGSGRVVRTSSERGNGGRDDIER